MNFNNFTIKAQEVVQKAVQLTRDNGNQAVEPEHLLKAVMTEGDAVVRFIFQKLDINPVNVERPLEAALKGLPHVSGGEPYLSNDASKVLEKANDIASKGGDQYVTVEAILMALFEVKSSVSSILKDAGMTRDDLRAAIDELRKGKNATSQSAGMDLRANLNEPVVLRPMERRLIPTGLYIALPEGYEAQVRPRSGLALKHGLTVLNAPGTIDADYRGEVGVVLINLSQEDFVINDGERIAQMVIARHEQAKFTIVEELDETERGTGGYGHTGVK